MRVRYVDARFTPPPERCMECGALIRRSEGTLCDGCAAAEEALPC